MSMGKVSEQDKGSRTLNQGRPRFREPSPSFASAYVYAVFW